MDIKDKEIHISESPRLSKKQIKIVLALTILTVLIIAGISLYTILSLTGKISEQKILLDQQEITIQNYKNSFTDLDVSANKNDKWVSPYKCHSPDNESVYSEDRRFYVGWDASEPYISVCNITTETALGELTGRSNYNNIMLFSYSNQDSPEPILFKYNTLKKELTYVTDKTLPENKKVAVFMAPNETQPERWSSDGTYALVSTSGCWGCEGIDVITFAYNTKNDSFVSLGEGVSDAVWINNKTVKWDKYVYRESSEEDEGGLDGYYLTSEKEGTYTKELP